jgi:hypothetical protein
MGPLNMGNSSWQIGVAAPKRIIYPCQQLPFCRNVFTTKQQQPGTTDTCILENAAKSWLSFPYSNPMLTFTRCFSIRDICAEYILYWLCLREYECSRWSVGHEGWQSTVSDVKLCIQNGVTPW